jgi:hypothetical protein
MSHSSAPSPADSAIARKSEYARATPPHAEPHAYEVRPSASGSGFDLISDALPTGRLHFEKRRVATGYAKLNSGCHPAVIYLYDEAGLLISTAQHLDVLQ